MQPSHIQKELEYRRMREKLEDRFGVKRRAVIDDYIIGKVKKLNRTIKEVRVRHLRITKIKRELRRHGLEINVQDYSLSRGYIENDRFLMNLTHIVEKLCESHFLVTHCNYQGLWKAYYGKLFNTEKIIEMCYIRNKKPKVWPCRLEYLKRLFRGIVRVIIFSIRKRDEFYHPDNMKEYIQSGEDSFKNI